MRTVSLGWILGTACLVPDVALPAQPQVARATTPVLGSAQIVTTRWTRMDALVDGNLDGVMDAVGFWTSLRDETRGELRFFANDGTGRMSETLLLGDVPIPKNHPLPDVAIGDWDGDGHDDVALNHFDGRFSYFVSRAGGPVWHTQTRFLPPGAITSMVAGNFDGDRFCDVALLTTSHLYLFLNKSGVPSILGHERAAGGESLRVVDLDADGNMDLILTDFTTRELRLLKVDRPANWIGPVATAVTQLARFTMPGTGTFHAACGDYDADGDDDVVVFHASGEYQSFDQTSTGTFVGSAMAIGGPATALADIDGDGDLDGICCGSGGGTGTGRANTVAVVFEVSRNDGGRFRPAVAVPNIGARHIAGAADMNADGAIDLVAGRGILFSAARFGMPVTWSTLEPAVPMPRTTAAVDYDGDGDLDFLTDDIRLVFRNRGDGRFAWHTMRRPAPPAGAQFDTRNYFHGDWDGDGDVDVLMPVLEIATGQLRGMHLLENADGVTFTDAGPITPGGDSLRLGNSTQEQSFTADINGDGLDDLVANNLSHTPSTRIFINQGNRRFLETPQSMLKLRVIDVRDLNNDGRADIVTHNFFVTHGRGGASVYWGQSSGLLGARSDFLTARHSDTLKLVDYDGDGDLDVFSKYASGGNLALFVNDGAGGFTQHILIKNIQRSEFYVADFDGDGRSDVAIVPGGEPGTAHVFNSSANGQFEWREQALAELANHRIGDFDGDGDADIVGSRFLASIGHHGPAAGRAEQFGVATAGSAGRVPHLGASGPFRPGSFSAIYLRHRPGSSAAVLAIGSQRVNLPGFPWASVNTYVDPQLVHVLVGFDSRGRFTTGMQLTPGLANLNLVFQAYVLDATAPSGFVSTNGLEVRYGK